MNTYTEPAAPATKTATDSTAPQAQSWRDILQIHPAADLFPRMSPDELRGARRGHHQERAQVVRSCCGRTDKSPACNCSTAAIGSMRSRSRPPVRSIVGPPSVMAGKDFLAVNKVIVLDRSVDPYAYVISANIHRRHLDRRAEARGHRSPDQGAAGKIRSADRRDDGRKPSRRSATVRSRNGRTWGNSPRRNPDRQQGPQAARTEDRDEGVPSFGEGVATARGRSRTHSRSDGRQQGPRRHRLRRARANANCCVHATKNCKPSLRILSSRTSRSAARSGN